MPAKVSPVTQSNHRERCPGFVPLSLSANRRGYAYQPAVFPWLRATSI